MAKKTDTSFSITVCTGKECKRNNAEKLLGRFEELVEEQELGDTVQLERCSCLKKCKKGPAIKIMPGEVVVAKLKPNKAEKYLQKILAGKFSEKRDKKK